MNLVATKQHCAADSVPHEAVAASPKIKQLQSTTLRLHNRPQLKCVTDPHRSSTSSLQLLTRLQSWHKLYNAAAHGKGACSARCRTAIHSAELAQAVPSCSATMQAASNEPATALEASRTREAKPATTQTDPCSQSDKHIARNCMGPRYNTAPNKEAQRPTKGARANMSA